jgi:pterin-4a-carbinolamine dehydratase
VKLSKLHEEFIDSARRPMSLGRLPIKPTQNDVAIIPTNKWVTSKDPPSIKKKYQFLSQKSRNSFINGLLEYEEESHHNAKISIEEDNVFISLVTKDVEQVTEIDKEYARFADELFRDLAYNPSR